MMNPLFSLLPHGVTPQEEIYRSPEIVILRCMHQKWAQRVVVKMPSTSAPSPSRIADIRRDYKAMRQFQGAGIVKALELVESAGVPLLVMEDWQGRSLAQWVEERPFSLQDVVRITLLVAQALEGIHQKQCVHLGLTPAHIIWSEEQGRLGLIGLGGSISQDALASSLQTLDTTPTIYMAPECLGQIAAPIDRRSDLYALGVVAWQLLVGEASIALVSPDKVAHPSARLPPPEDLRKGIPSQLSQIIDKATSRHPKDRYQSAQGLAHDLQRWSGHYEKGQTVAFALGQRDRLTAPAALYERQHECQELAQALRNTQEATVRLLIHGAAGVGKTTLIQSIKTEALSQRGFFAEGRFAQQEQRSPYSGILAVLRSAVAQILERDDDQVRRAQWRYRLEKALGASSAWLLKLLPELGALLETTTSGAPLLPEESLHRAHYAFLTLMRELATPERPQVFFFDDVQWADPASLELLTFLFEHIQERGILLVCSYRDEEVSAASPIATLASTLTTKGIAAIDMALRPLGLPGIVEWLATLSQRPPQELTPLAALLHDKTAGNPYFLRAVIERLWEQEQLSQPLAATSITDALSALRKLEVTDNVAPLLIDKIHKLPEASREALQTAACLGRSFVLDQLSSVLGHSLQEVDAFLRPALETGIVFEEIAHPQPSTEKTAPGSFRFAHDKVREAAHSMIHKARLPGIHLSIGRRLLQESNVETSDALFAIIEHMSHAPDKLEDTERIELARLHLVAGERAAESAAFENAHKLFESGLQTMGPSRWERAPALSQKLCIASTQACVMRKQTKELKVRFDELLLHVPDLVEQLPAWLALIQGHRFANELEEAMQAAETFLRRAGRPLPHRTGIFFLLWGLFRTRLALRGRSPEELRALPQATNLLQRGIIDVQMTIAIVHLQLRPNAVPYSILHDVQTILQYGTTGLGALAWTGYAMILAAGFRKYALARAFCELAQYHVDREHIPALQPLVECFKNFNIDGWVLPLTQLQPPLRRLAREALEYGDIQVAQEIEIASIELFSFTGAPLETQIRHIEESFARFHQGFQPRWQLVLRAQQRILRDLLNPTLAPAPYHTLIRHLPTLDSQVDHCAMSMYICQIQLALMFGTTQEYATLAMHDCTEIQLPIRVIHRGPFWTYTLVALYASETPQGRLSRKINKRIKQGLKALTQWCQHVPETRKYRLAWVEAAKLQYKDRHAEALTFYERALDQASHGGFLHDASLIGEQAGRLCLKIGNKRMADAFLQDALFCYQQWGCLAKVNDLLQVAPHLQRTLPEAGYHAADIEHSSFATPGGTVYNIETTSRAAEALLEVRQLDPLAQRLMRLVLETTDAQKGWLLLKKDTTWQLSAEALLDEEEVRLPRLELSLDDDDALLPTALLRYVALTHEALVLEDAVHRGPFVRDPYVKWRQPRSLLCMPLLDQNKLVGILYLENHLAAATFHPKRQALLQVILVQAARSIQAAIDLDSSQHKHPSTPKSSVIHTTDQAESRLPTPRNTPSVNTLRTLVGQSIGGWQIVRLLGIGGMAVVYEAVKKEQRAAIKLLQAKFHASDENTQRFRREAETISQLNHPNIISIIEIGTDPEYGLYLALEYLKGQDFASLLKQHTPLPIGWLLPFGEQLCHALQVTHNAGIVHRDLKPSNVFLLPHEPFPIAKLLDFGIAKSNQHIDDTRLTNTGAVIGTPAYLSPEQLKENGKLTPATDLYALGVILFEALTGKHPLGEGSHIELFVKILQEKPTLLGEYRPEFEDTPLEELLQRILSKDPLERPVSASQLWDEFEMACQFLEDPLDQPDLYPTIQEIEAPLLPQESNESTDQHSDEDAEARLSKELPTPTAPGAVTAQLPQPQKHVRSAPLAQTPTLHDTAPPHPRQSALAPRAPKSTFGTTQRLALLLIVLLCGGLWWRLSHTTRPIQTTLAPRTQQPSTTRPLLQSQTPGPETQATSLQHKGLLAFQRGRYNAAIHAWQGALTLSIRTHTPAPPALYQQLSQAHEAQRHFYLALDMARRHHAFLVQANPQPDALAQSHKRIKLLQEQLSSRIQRVHKPLVLLPQQLKKELWLLAHINYQRIIQSLPDHPPTQRTLATHLQKYFPALAQRAIQRIPKQEQPTLLPLLQARQAQQRLAQQEGWKRVEQRLAKRQFGAATQLFQTNMQDHLALCDASTEGALRNWLLAQSWQFPQHAARLWSAYFGHHQHIATNGLRLWLASQMPTLTTTPALLEQQQIVQQMLNIYRNAQRFQKALARANLQKASRYGSLIAQQWKTLQQREGWGLRKPIPPLQQILHQTKQLTYQSLLYKKIIRAYTRAEFSKLAAWQHELLQLSSHKAMRRKWTASFARQQAQQKLALQMLQRGQSAYQDKQWRTARTMYLRYLKDFPKAWNAPQVQKQLKACRCILKVRFWELCSAKDFPPHYRRK